MICRIAIWWNIIPLIRSRWLKNTLDSVIHIYIKASCLIVNISKQSYCQWRTEYCWTASLFLLQLCLQSQLQELQHTVLILEQWDLAVVPTFSFQSQSQDLFEPFWDVDLISYSCYSFHKCICKYTQLPWLEVWSRKIWLSTLYL